MATIQVTNIPDDLHDRLCEHAKKRNTSVDDLVVDAIERQIDRIEFHDELVSKKMLRPDISPSEFVARERECRDAPIEI